MKCQYCKRPCASKNGLRSHETTCKNNPNRIKGKCGNGWDKVDRKEFGKKISAANKARDSSINEKISKTCLRKARNGKWHHGAGRSKKYVYHDVKLDSSWELKLVLHWDKHGIIWERNVKRFPYVWNGKERSYLPDFYLPEQDLYVEVKGYKTERDEAKWSAFTETLIVYDKEKFQQENIAL